MKHNRTLTDRRLGVRERLQHHSFGEGNVVEEDVRCPLGNDAIDMHSL